MKCSMELLEQLKGADTDRSIVLATSRSLTFGGGWRGNAFEICFACGCRAILLEGKSDKRHSGQSHLRHQGFFSSLQERETFFLLKQVELGRAFLNTFIQRECVKCSMELLEQLKGADTDRSIVLATSRSLTFGGWQKHVAFKLSFLYILRCQPILFEGKADKRHSGQSPCFQASRFLQLFSKG